MDFSGLERPQRGESVGSANCAVRPGNPSSTKFQSAPSARRATPVQLEAVGAWQASRIEHLGDGRYVLAGGGGLLETSPGEYIVVDTAASP